MMLEYSWYSVISPEGCAAILWRDAAKAPEAAEALKVTSSDVKELGIVDRVIPEPPGGAHNDPQTTANAVRDAVIESLNQLANRPIDELLDARLEKYRRIGELDEPV